MLLLVAFLAGDPAAAVDADRLILPGLDPLLNGTEDPRLLGPERMLLRERLAIQGVDPYEDDGFPTLDTLYEALLEPRLGVDMEREAEVTEISGTLGIETTFRYPEWFFLFQSPKKLPGGFVYYPPRDVGADVVEIFIDDPEIARQRRFAMFAVRSRLQMLDVAGAGTTRDRGDGINLTIPVHFPRTLERIIGRGEKTNIRISGREHISISGESAVSNRFTPNERRQNASLFPSLDMEQQLQINLNGQIGEKIMIEVEHNSEVIGPEATKIRLRYEGDEDEIIQSIETGDVGLTLPGSQLLGYSSNKSGLFGVKVTGQVGRADFTVVASKQKAESSSKSFNSKGGSDTEHVIESSRYLNNRFFRLDLPPGYQPFHGFDVADFPGRQVDVFDPTGGERIGLGSIQIFEFVGNTRPQPGDIQFAVAIPDSTGRWPLPSQTVAGADNIVNIDGAAPLATQAGEWWRPVSFDLLTDQDENVVAVDLGHEYDFNAALAMVYNVTDRNGNVLYRVGDMPGVHETERVDWFGDGNMYLRMKLLKPAEPGDDPHLWQHVLRNIYPLGGSNIDASSFTFRMEVTTFSDQPHQDVTPEGGSGLDIFRIFGLDQENQQGVAEPDGLPDTHDQLVFDFDRGLLKFPLNMPRPFAMEPSYYEGIVDQLGIEDPERPFTFESSVLSDKLRPKLYEPTNSETDLTQSNNTFRFVVTHASASGSFNLGVSNIEEESEVVTLNGRTLTRDVDYTIDYTFGQIDLKGQAAAELTSDSSISVTYQYAPFLGGGNSSLLGLNMGYDLGRESKLSTTWLYESNQVIGKRAKLGEEPSRTLVGNINGQLMARPGFLTDFANLLSRTDTDRESSVSLSGELAVSVPNPNTFDDAGVEDFEGIDSSDMMPITRLSWNPTSVPNHDAGLGVLDLEDEEDYGYLLDTDFTPEARLETRWFLPRVATKRVHLNPTLKDQEANEIQQVLQVHMRTGGAEWQPEHWGGIMRGLSRNGIDLTQAQFLEFWVNDYRHDVLGDAPTGTLHFDFGKLSEDFYWPEEDGLLETGTFQEEDGVVAGTDPDGIFSADEDIGLGGIGAYDDGCSGPDCFSADYGSDSNPYQRINGTKLNNREDSEDLDGDTNFDTRESFFTISVDLADSALVDILRDNSASEVADNISEKRAWRKYRVRLGDMLPVIPPGGSTPSLSNVTHMRIWFEDRDADPTKTTQNLQFTEIRFLGSRWEREGVRRVATAGDPDEVLLEPAERGAGEGFFLGEVNNKEDANYQPPFPLVELNNVEEKETSLVLDFQEIEPQHLVRVSRMVSPRGDDYTRYDKLSWYIHNPSPHQADLDIFFRVGADTLNYYEINYRFDESRGARSGWKEIRLDLAELSNSKLVPRDPVTNWITTTVRDTETGDDYRVRVVGAPDLRRVKRLYFGVRNLDRTTPASGILWFNDVRLRGVKRETGLAERLSMRVDLAGRIGFDVDWSKQDAEFHGLNKDVGSGVTNEDWNISTNFNVNDYVPLLGFRIPVSLGKQRRTQRPKYVTNSDIEILDETRRSAESTINARENFSVQLRRPNPSGFAPLRYVLDPWTLSLSGARSEDISPLTRSDGRNLQGQVSYDLRFPQNQFLGKIGFFRRIPIIKSVIPLPTNVSFSANMNVQTRESSSWSELDDAFVEQPVNETRRGTINGKFGARPLPVLDVDVTLRSDRDLFRERRIMGLNIGAENIFDQQVQLRITPPTRLGLPDSPWVSWITTVTKSINEDLRPSVTFNGTFTDDQSPGVAQSGDPVGTHNVRNGGDWNTRIQVPVGRTFESIFPRKVEVQGGERQRILRNLIDRDRRGMIEDQELQSLLDSYNDRNTREDEKQRLENEIVRLAMSLEEERRRRLSSGAETDTTGVDDEAADWNLDEGGFRIPNPAGPVLHVLRGIEPLQISYSKKEDGGYTRLRPGVDPGFWFRAGLAHDTEVPDSLYTARNESDRSIKSLTTKVKLSRWVNLDVKFNETISNRFQAGLRTRSVTTDWPDLQLSLGGLEKLPLLGGGGSDSKLQTATMNLTYKISDTASGSTPTQFNPQRRTQFSPRLSLNFRSQLTASLNVNITDDTNENNGTLTESGRFNVGAQIRYSFSAERFLSRLGFFQPGNSPRVTMDLDLQFSNDSTKRWLPLEDRTGEPHTETGTSRISVNPRFSYNINRNLSGAMRLIYARDEIKETETVTQRFGLGLEATFTF